LHDGAALAEIASSTWKLRDSRAPTFQFPVPRKRNLKGCTWFGALCENSKLALRTPVAVSGLKRTEYCT
jgi:hypothetical protein